MLPAPWSNLASTPGVVPLVAVSYDRVSRPYVNGQTREVTRATAQDKPSGPDLAQGVPLGDVPDGGMLAGHVDSDAVLVARRGDKLYAIGATCTHYSGPLAEGLVVGETVHCPWHHARFCLRTGEA